MRLLIDMDGVTCDLLSAWIDWINKEFPPFKSDWDRPTLQQTVRIAGVNPKKIGHFKTSDIRQWDTGKATGLGPDVFKFFETPRMFANLQPIPDAVGVLEALHKDGHEIHFVTASTTGHEDKLAWVRQHTPFITPNRVQFVQEKHIVCGDILFDDKPETIERALFERAQAPDYFPQPVIMDQPYNRHVHYAKFGALLRVSNWHQFYGIVKARSIGSGAMIRNS